MVVSETYSSILMVTQLWFLLLESATIMKKLCVAYETM